MAQGYGYRNTTFPYGGNPPFGQQPRAPPASVAQTGDTYKFSPPTFFNNNKPPGVVTNNTPPPIENRVVTAAVVDSVPVVAPRLNPQRPETWRNSQTADNYSPRKTRGTSRNESSTSPERIEPAGYPRGTSSPRRTYQGPITALSSGSTHVASPSTSEMDKRKAEAFATKLQEEAVKATAAAEVLGSSTTTITGGGGSKPNRSYKNGFNHTTPTPAHHQHSADHDPEKVKELIHKVGNWGLSRTTHTYSQGKQKYSNTYDEQPHTQYYNGKSQQQQQPQYYYGGNEHQTQGQEYYYVKPHRGYGYDPYGYGGSSTGGYYDPSLSTSSKRSGNNRYALNSTEVVNKYNGVFIY